MENVSRETLDNSVDSSTSSTESTDNLIGVGVGFHRIRRITGYLVGDYKSRFNDAKRSEVEDRVKHFTIDLHSKASRSPQVSQ